VKQQRVDERLGFAVTNFHTWCRFGPKYDVTGLTKQFSLHNFPCTHTTMSTELQSSKLGTKEQYVQVKKMEFYLNSSPLVFMHRNLSISRKSGTKGR